MIQQSNSIYIYQVNDILQLPNPDWSLLHCVASPFAYEYFIVSRSNDKDYVLHTKSQGEYKLSDFTTSPQIIKVSNQNLDDRVFIEDKRTNTTYELTSKEGNSLINSDDYISKLTSILEEKNK